MRDPEGVVHVEVAALNQPVDESGVVGLLTRFKAEVLQQFHALGSVTQPSLHRGRAGSHRGPVSQPGPHRGGADPLD